MAPRVVFMGNPGYGGLVLEELLRLGVDVAGVFHLDDRMRHRLRRTYRRYLKTPKGRRDILPRLRDKLGRLGDQKLPRSTFGGDVIPIARQSGIPLFPGSYVHRQECAAALRRLDVEVVLVATFSEILPREILSVAKLAAINMHPSLLPAYRGGFPEFSAIYDGQETTGITFHLMEERFDAGNILLQRELEIPPGETTLGLKRRLAKLACEAIPELLDRIGTGDLAGVPQDRSKRSYTRLPPDFERVHKGMSVAQIRRLISACEDLEDIGRPYFVRNGETIYPLSWAQRGLAFPASDGAVYFDVVRFRHKILSGDEIDALATLIA